MILISANPYIFILFYESLKGEAMSFLTKMFPKKVKTLQEFITLVEEEKISSILIMPFINGSCDAILIHEARSNAGRRIIYRDMITQRNGGLRTAWAFVNMPGAIRKESIRLCLVGEQRIKALQRKLPHVNIHLTFEGKVMESFEELHRKAKAEGIF